VKGTLHWVSARHSITAELRQYNPLFTDEEPELDGEGGLAASLNPDSLEVLTECRLEPALEGARAGDLLQLERVGYYCVDPESQAGSLVLNRTATLRDTWAKVAKQGGHPAGRAGRKKNRKEKG
jgi:glutaminyl-tRNA synthetase